MEVLTAIKAMLERNEAVIAAMKGSVWLNHQGMQDEELPNIVLTLMGGSDNWTHQGPTGLLRQTIRVMYRAKTDVEVVRLSKAGSNALNGRSGIYYDMTILQCMRTQQTSDFNDLAQIQRQIDSYVVSWQYNSEP